MRIPFKQDKYNTIYFKTKNEKKTNSTMDIKAYDKQKEANLSYPLHRLEFCFKGAYFNNMRLTDIDLIQDNTEFSIFKYSILDSRKKTYELAYYSEPLYLNTLDTTSVMLYDFILVQQYNGDYKNITNIDKNPTTYKDYCKICKSNNSIEDNLITGKTYTINSVDGQNMFLSLDPYTIKISGPSTEGHDYFIVQNLQIDSNSYVKNLPIKNYKEKNILKKLFKITDDTTLLEMAIITIKIANIPYNIIIWKTKTLDIKIIGRFEDRFNKPGNYEGEWNIVYDSNNNQLEQTQNKSYIFTTYIKQPLGEYIKLKELPMEYINKYKLSLFHVDNVDAQQQEDLTPTEKNTKSNTKKLISTCAWGECQDLEKIPIETAQNYLQRINKFEKSYNYRQLGGQLDSNMIHFIKNISGDEETNDHNKINLVNKYVNKETSYFTNSYLLDILFKKNDIIEFYKIFGTKGWTNSYNSIYSKKLFTINKSNNDITDLDYYDSFRNIYPVSWLEKKFALNVENIWKYNNWFNDSPHFRSLPNWKFELVQAIETRAVDVPLQIKLGGTNCNKMNLCNFIKNPLIIFIIIIIGIFIIKQFKLI